ncbi:hypothetical protein C1I97_30560 [Streptomyces sp. NTH33]|nr:hypothetical protein C1I97_30560 [Streptomyces sp. NTH33]
MVTAFASQLPTDAGSRLRQQQMLRTAIGSLVTTSRTAMPAQGAVDALVALEKGKGSVPSC